MEKRLLILPLVLTIMVELNAQTSDLNKNSNEISFNGHVIRVYRTTSSGYIYDIFFQNHLIIHQNNNPFTGSADGLRTKEDGLKIAKWQIIHLDPLHRQPISGPQKVPIEVARQLKISGN